MNKQELINKIHQLPSNFTYDKVSVSKENVLNLVNQLEENNKVKIPQFVVKWLKECKSNINTIEYFITEAPEDISEWMSCNRDGNMDKLARAWLDGYDIEKEPLYIVILTDKVRGGVIQLFKNIEGLLYFNVESDIRYGIGYELTEQEIRNEDERLWHFAIPVEDING